jgi:hypothetical protein
MPTNWQDEVTFELQAARKAARENLVGRSRVSARRASGRAIKEYYSQACNRELDLNFYDLLVVFAREPDLPDDIRTIAQHLCQRVDQDHMLPGNIDLLIEAERLFQFIRDKIDAGMLKDKHGK